MAKKKGLKTIIAGPRDFEDYEVVKKAIEESGFEIAEVCSGKAQGVDTLGEDWADENKIKIKPFPAKWKDLDVEGAVIKEGKFGKYNAMAGFTRNQEMADYADALIAINKGDTSGTADMIKRAKAKGLKVFIYEVEKQDSEFEYTF
jgi:hypothetical protein